MSVKVVISQPMLFPWLGMIEQFRMADIFIFYDDASFSKGSFTNRVQYKCGDNTAWLTIPLVKSPLGTPINQTKVGPGSWKRKHLATLSQNYAKASHVEDMIDVASNVYDHNWDTICEYSIQSVLLLVDYLGVGKNTKTYYSSELDVTSNSSEKVLELVKKVGGTEYISGHGGKNYLDHEMFESNGVEVNYMEYDIQPYQQFGKTFTPYVSTLDTISVLGRDALSVAHSTARTWRSLLNE